MTTTEENKLFVSSCLKNNVSQSFLNSNRGGAKRMAITPLNKKLCGYRKKTEPFENCSLIQLHTFKKNALVKLRNFSERRAQISEVCS
jgi:hypothetical protein